MRGLCHGAQARGDGLEPIEARAQLIPELARIGARQLDAQAVQVFLERDQQIGGLTRVELQIQHSNNLRLVRVKKRGRPSWSALCYSPDGATTVSFLRPHRRGG